MIRLAEEKKCVYWEGKNNNKKKMPGSGAARPAYVTGVGLLQMQFTIFKFNAY
jgi:hypothetical protein